MQSATTEKDPLQWYVLVVKAGKEPFIKRALLDDGELKVEDLIIPDRQDLILSKLRNKDFKHIYAEMQERYKLFLGYFFLKVFLSQDVYRKILSIDDVYHFLGKSVVKSNHRIHSPLPIDNDEIRTVKNYLTLKKIEVKPVTKKFEVNEEVTIVNGDLSDVKGKIIQITNGYAKIMPLSFFHKIINVPLSHLCKT
jgi:transcription antitermination factor NusG